MIIKQFKMLLAAGAALTAIAAGAAYADPLPGLSNLDFTQYSGSNPKGTFFNVAPTGWNGPSAGDLIYVVSQTPGQRAADSVGGTITTYGNPTGSISGNYIEADGNPEFESSFGREITGLTAGQTYTLSFYQGASQQVGFHGATTNQWIVSLADTNLLVGGTCGPNNNGTGPNDPVYGATMAYCSSDAQASIAASPLMHIADGGVVGWNFVSVELTAHATTERLSFLAWGNNGSTANLPPMAFLAAVDAPPGLGNDVPEPATWALILLGFAGLGGSLRRQRARRAAVALQA
jgi:hypothetical protein